MYSLFEELLLLSNSKYYEIMLQVELLRGTVGDLILYKMNQFLQVVEITEG